MEFNLIFDALIAVLLVATIFYAAVLNRKLGALRDAKDEMAALLVSFAESTKRAGNGVELLKQEAGRSGAALQNKVTAARGLVDDLGFLIEKGTSLAQRIDGGVGTTRAKPAAAKSESKAASAKSVPGNAVRDAMGEPDPSGDAALKSAVPEPSPPEPAAAELSAAESELLKALQGMR